MTKRLAVTSITLALAVCGGLSAFAVGLDQTIVNVDLDASTLGVTETSNAASPWAVGQVYKTLLVLEPQTPGETIDDLTGVSADVQFDDAVLELVDAYELAGDINFDGFQDVGDLVQIFQSDAFDMEKGDEGYIGYYDINRDDYVDVGDLVNVFQSEQFDSAGDPYWTNNEGDYVRESVEIFDNPALSNTGGDHPGFVDDLVSVLLLRPDADSNGVADDGSGYDVAPFSGSRAIIATLEWKVKAGAAGTTDIVVMSAPDAGLPTSNGPVAIGSTSDVNNPETPTAGTSTVTIQ